VWWHVTVIPALGRRGRESRFDTNLGFILRPCLKKNQPPPHTQNKTLQTLSSCNLYIILFIYFFETVSLYVVKMVSNLFYSQTGLELEILLPQLSGGWDYRCAPPPAIYIFQEGG
jgi:hypothetical protein